MSDPTEPPACDDGRSLFRQWCGNSYEWDALTDLLQERWNRLARIIASAAPKDEWASIESAPKDGTRIQLYRPPAEWGKWGELVIAEFRDEAWRWPDKDQNPTFYGEWTEDELNEGYADHNSPCWFTHWRPLPPAPAMKGAE